MNVDKMHDVISSSDMSSEMTSIVEKEFERTMWKKVDNVACCAAADPFGLSASQFVRQTHIWLAAHVRSSYIIV